MVSHLTLPLPKDIKSNRVLNGSCQLLGWLLAAFNPRNLLKESTIHPGFLWVHHATKFILFPILRRRGTTAYIRGTRRCSRCVGMTWAHLFPEELLVLNHLVLSSLIRCCSLLIGLIRLLDHAMHIGLIGTSIILLAHSLLVNLLCEGLCQLDVLRPHLVLLVNIMKLCLFILFDTLLNVFFLLPETHLFAVVADHLAHLVHLLLDPAATLSDFPLSCLLFLKSDPHVSLKLVSISLLDCFDVCHPLLLFHHVVLNDLHCSLALLDLSLSLRLLLFLEVGSKLRTTFFLLILSSHHLFNLLLFRLLHHSISHLLGFGGFDKFLSLLFTFDFHFFLRLVQDLTIKVLSFFLILLTEFSPELDLFVQHVSHLYHFLHLNLLLLLDLLFV